MLPVKRPDPAPSRVKYRLERLWLTPGFRRLVRVWLPAGILAAIGFAIWSNPFVQAYGGAKLGEMRMALAARPELTIERVVLDGVSTSQEAAMRRALALDLPVSALDLDLAKLRETLLALEPVEAARLRFDGVSTLHVEIKERVPAALWRMGGALHLVDATGARIGRAASRAAHGDLPVLAGAGAEAAVEEALEILEVAAPLAGRIRGLVRIGARRWDLELDRGQVIRLPETGAREAMLRLLALDKAKDLLERDLSFVDLRDGARPVVRLRPEALDLMNALERKRNEDDV